VLNTLNVLEKPMIICLNKIDKVERESIHPLLRRIKGSVAISSLHKIGLEALLDRLINLPIFKFERLTIKLPIKEWKLYSWIKREGRLYHEKYGENDVTIEFEAPLYLTSRLKQFALY
jgi:GTP-binding protein HflX